MDNMTTEPEWCPETTVWYPGDENVRVACDLPKGHEGKHYDNALFAEWPEDDD